jgi:hypothetical protein
MGKIAVLCLFAGVNMHILPAKNVIKNLFWRKPFYEGISFPAGALYVMA